MLGNHYGSFIEEAFVKPIRSVLIVDDDYPTLDDLLKSGSEGQPNAVRDSKAWRSDPQKIKAVIDRFREGDRSLLVDIHDGSNVSPGDDAEIASHLHQSDLLVLDYQLDRTKLGDGSRALQIIRRLATNDHFNLVIVHTSEVLDVVFRDTALSLLMPCGEKPSEGEIKAAEDAIFAADTDREGFEDAILESIGKDQYLRFRQDRRAALKEAMKGEGAFSRFHQLCSEAGWKGKLIKDVFLYIIEICDRKYASSMICTRPLDLTWDQAGVRYIRADSLFIAFSNKSGDEDLIADLRSALEAWCPQPSRLFLSKLRSEVDEAGVLAQRPALENRHALAHWYSRLVEADGPRRKWMVAESVRRHSEQLMAGILPGVQDFATRLVEAERGVGSATDLSNHHFKVNLADESDRRTSEREHNALVSSKPVEGWHLTTGHVFEIEGDYWVCVSPACDMVPDQLSSEKKARLGEWLPFNAVKLVSCSDGKDVDANSNRYLFLKIGSTVKVFCFNDPSRDASSPSWYTMYAESLGHLTDDNRVSVVLPRLNGTDLGNSRHNANVVTQLRYEYALSLLQRLGVSQTRIGLDYVGRVTG